MSAPDAHSRVAVVTGASSGIGEATAKVLAAQGFHVVAVARRADRIEALAAEIDGTAIVADVTDDAAVAALADSGNGLVVTVTSIAAFETYDGGSGYTSAKHAQGALHRTLRGELLGKPVRLTEIAPGAVETEFSLLRFDGDEQRAGSVYTGITPLVAQDVAEVIGFVASRPSHVDLDQIVIRPRDQAPNGRFNRQAR